MFLSDEEKKKFLEYLESVRVSSLEVAKQLNNLAMPQAIIDAMNRREKILASAASVLIDYINKGEGQTIR